jgi:hypothetical protein
MVPVEEPLTLRSYDFGTYLKENGDTVIFRKPNMVHVENVAYRAKFEPTLTAKIPRGYIIPKSMEKIAEQLQLHGIIVETLKERRSFEGEIFQIEKLNNAARRFEGHFMVSLDGAWKLAERNFEEGDFWVDAAQPLGHLIFYLLEPQSDDGLTAWNFLDDAVSDGKEFPVFKVLK